MSSHQMTSLVRLSHALPPHKAWSCAVSHHSKDLNGLVSKFWNREEGYDYIRVSWAMFQNTIPGVNHSCCTATRQQLERDYLPHERDARIQGKPIMGKGAVFQIRTWPTYRTGDIPFQEMRNISRVIALDLGLGERQNSDQSHVLGSI
jgi:hypothetical protein